MRGRAKFDVDDDPEFVDIYQQNNSDQAVNDQAPHVVLSKVPVEHIKVPEGLDVSHDLAMAGRPISPCTFAALARGCAQHDDAVPADKWKVPHSVLEAQGSQRPRPAATKKPTAGKVPREYWLHMQMQYDEETGDMLSPFYELPTTPSVIWSPTGVTHVELQDIEPPLLGKLARLAPVMTQKLVALMYSLGVPQQPPRDSEEDYSTSEVNATFAGLHYFGPKIGSHTKVSLENWLLETRQATQHLEGEVKRLKDDVRKTKSRKDELIKMYGTLSKYINFILQLREEQEGLPVMEEAAAQRAAAAQTARSSEEARTQERERASEDGNAHLDPHVETYRTPHAAERHRQQLLQARMDEANADQNPPMSQSFDEGDEQNAQEHADRVPNRFQKWLRRWQDYTEIPGTDQPGMTRNAQRAARKEAKARAKAARKAAKAKSGPAGQRTRHRQARIMEFIDANARDHLLRKDMALMERNKAWGKVQAQLRGAWQVAWKLHDLCMEHQMGDIPIVPEADIAEVIEIAHQGANALVEELCDRALYFDATEREAQAQAEEQEARAAEQQRLWWVGRQIWQQHVADMAAQGVQFNYNPYLYFPPPYPGYAQHDPDVPYPPPAYPGRAQQAPQNPGHAYQAEWPFIMD